ncbi:hypothetical protein G7013_05175 [Pseudomonas viridiflava]|nr:hypothetical protein [Pseudomonas viridiflava]MBA1229041.1 hypothetical protein [Pseudomonas viridiflava]
MLTSAPTQVIAQASARRSANGVAVQAASATGHLQLNAYYGYWFSHWRA